jgi:DNA topoisomerase IA
MAASKGLLRNYTKGTTVSKPLVVVESPTKVRTIKKYLGNSYNVAATVGHIKDLPTKEMGIDFIEVRNFIPVVEWDKYSSLLYYKGEHNKFFKELKRYADYVDEHYKKMNVDKDQFQSAMFNSVLPKIRAQQTLKYILEQVTIKDEDLDQ